MGLTNSKQQQHDDEISAEEIAAYVVSLGSSFQQYEASLRTSGMSGSELAGLDDDCLGVVLDSLKITNRLHRRKLTSVCRKQLKQRHTTTTSNHQQAADWDNCSIHSIHSIISTSSAGTLPPPSLLNLPSRSIGGNSTHSTASRSYTPAPPPPSLSRHSSFGSASASNNNKPTNPMTGALENMCVGQAQEALGLLVCMENEKRLLRKADRPSGPPLAKAAIVLTDVQGSTALWEANPQAMRHALTLHDEIIRELRAEHGGYEIDTEGDAFFLAFHTANDALGFALGLQERLREADWDDDILALPDACDCAKTFNRGLRVRMGIHMGPVTTSKNAVTGRLEYKGATMDTARQVEGMADGGQILASSQTWEAACIAAPIETRVDGVVQVLCAQRRAKLRESLGSMHSLTAAGSAHSVKSRVNRRRFNSRNNVGLNSQSSFGSSFASINSTDDEGSDDGNNNARWSGASVSSSRHSKQRRSGKRPTPARSQSMGQGVTPTAAQRLAAAC